LSPTGRDTKKIKDLSYVSKPQADRKVKYLYTAQHIDIGHPEIGFSKRAKR